MVIHGDFGIERCFVFYGAFDSPAAGMTVPDAIIKAELDFLLDIAGEVIRHDPGGVNVERRFPTGIVFINHA